MPFYQEGLYEVEVKETGIEQSKAGNPMIILKVMVQSFVDANQANAHVPVQKQYERIIRITVTDDENQKKFALMKLRNAGWTGDKFELLHDMEGMVVFAECEHETQTDGEYKGRVNERWDLPLPPRESKPIENKPALAKKLNALFGKSLKESKAPEPKASEPVATTVGEPDEVPF